MIEWLKANKSGATVIGVAVALFVLLYVSQGCSVYDIVKMPVPTKVQATTGSAATIPLSEYPSIRQQYLENTTKGVEQLDASYTEQAFWADLMASGVSLGIDIGSAEAATLPGGALLTTLIAGIGGLMLRKPGDGKTIEALKQQLAEQAKAELERLAKEKMDSYNAGIKVGEGKAG